MAADTNGLDIFVGGELFSFVGVPTGGLDHFDGGELIRGVTGAAGTAYVETPGGGVKFGARSSPSVTFRQSPSGGVKLGGFSAPHASFSVSTSGGLKLGGSSTPGGSSTFSASGGVKFGGSVSVATANVVSASGGVVFGGFATVAGGGRSYVETASGGVVFGAAANVVSTYYDGATTQGALQQWWASRSDLQALTSDGKLWHLEAPEGVDLPYVTFFQVAETERDGRTTGYTYLESVIQFSVHAETDEGAATTRKALRAAVLKAPLSIDGEPVWYVLPGDQTLSIGEGFGRHGRDCWIATVDVTIPWQTDAV